MNFKTELKTLYHAFNSISNLLQRHPKTFLGNNSTETIPLHNLSNRKSMAKKLQGKHRIQNISSPATADSNVHALGAFLREVLHWGRWECHIGYILCCNVLPHSLCLLTVHSLSLIHLSSIPRTEKRPKSHPGKACEPPTPTLLPCKHMHGSRVPQTCQVTQQVLHSYGCEPVWSSPDENSQNPLMHPQLQIVQIVPSLCFWCKVSPLSAAMVASSYSRIGSGPRRASASKGAKDTPQTFALLQHLSHSWILSAEQSRLDWSAS